MRVSADERIRIGNFNRRHATGFLHLFLFRPDGLREIFEIDLMADTGARRNNREVFKRLLTPFQEAIALAIALIFEADIFFE